MKYLIIVCILLTGCRIAKKAEPPPPPPIRKTSAILSESAAVIGNYSPGVISVEPGIMLVDIRTNQYVLIQIKELLTPNHQTVGRFVLNKEVYGNSVAIDPGWRALGEPPDRPRGHFMFSKTISETNQYVIEHWKELNP